MDSNIKRIIAIILVSFVLVLGYFGNYLAYKKSYTFIAALREAGTVASFDRFKEIFSNAFNIPSPIGQEEVVRNLASMVMSFASSRQSNPQLVDALIAYLQSYYEPIMQKGEGMSFTQNLYVLGGIYEAAYVNTKNPEYLLRATDYYKKGLEKGPRRPQFLYGLFDVYRLAGDKEKAITIGERILSHWPDDEVMRKAMEPLVAEMSAVNKN